MLSCFCLSASRPPDSAGINDEAVAHAQGTCSTSTHAAAASVDTSTVTKERGDSLGSEAQNSKYMSRNLNCLLTMSAFLKRRKPAIDVATSPAAQANGRLETRPDSSISGCAIASSPASPPSGPVASHADVTAELHTPLAPPPAAAAPFDPTTAVPGSKRSDTASTGAEAEGKQPSDSWAARDLARRLRDDGEGVKDVFKGAEQQGQGARCGEGDGGDDSTAVDMHAPRPSAGRVPHRARGSTSPSRGVPGQGPHDDSTTADHQSALRMEPPPPSRQQEQQQQQLQLQLQQQLQHQLQQHPAGGPQPPPPASVAPFEALAVAAAAAALAVGDNALPPNRKSTVRPIARILHAAPSPRTTNRALLIRQRTPRVARRPAPTVSGSSGFLDASPLVPASLLRYDSRSRMSSFYPPVAPWLDASAAAGAAAEAHASSGAVAPDMPASAAASSACGQPLPPVLAQSISQLRLRLAVSPRRPRFIDACCDSGTPLSPHTTAAALLGRQQTPYPLRWSTAWSAADSSYDGAASDVPYSGWGASVLAPMEPVTETQDALHDDVAATLHGSDAAVVGAVLGVVGDGGSRPGEGGKGGGLLRYTHTGSVAEGGAAERMASATSMTRPWSRASSLRSRFASPAEAAAAAPLPHYSGCHHHPLRALRVQPSLTKSRRPSVSSLVSLADADAPDPGALPVVLRPSNGGLGNLAAFTPTRRGRRRNLAGNENLLWDALMPRLPVLPAAAAAAAAATAGVGCPPATGGPDAGDGATEAVQGTRLNQQHIQLRGRPQNPQSDQGCDLDMGGGGGAMYGNNTGLAVAQVPFSRGQLRDRQQSQKQQYLKHELRPDGQEALKGLVGASSVEAPPAPLPLQQLSPLFLDSSAGIAAAGPATGSSRLRQSLAALPGPSPLRHQQPGSAPGGEADEAVDGASGAFEVDALKRGRCGVVRTDAMQAVWSVLDDLEMTPTSTAALAASPMAAAAVPLSGRQEVEDEAWGVDLGGQPILSYPPAGGEGIPAGGEAAHSAFSVVAIRPVSSTACRRFLAAAPAACYAFRWSPRAVLPRGLDFVRNTSGTATARATQSSDGRTPLALHASALKAAAAAAAGPDRSSPSTRPQHTMAARYSVRGSAATAAAAAHGAVSATYRRSGLSVSRSASVKNMAAAAMVLAGYFGEAGGGGDDGQQGGCRAASVGGTSMREGRRVLRHAGSVRSHAPTEDDSAESLARVLASELGCGWEKGSELGAEFCEQQLGVGSAYGRLYGTCEGVRCVDLDEQEGQGQQAGAGPEAEAREKVEAWRRSVAAGTGGGVQGRGGDVVKAGSGMPLRQALLGDLLLKASAPGLAGAGASSRLSRCT